MNLVIADDIPLPALQRARGAGRLATKMAAGRTALDALYQDGCCKIRLPNTHSDALEAVLINTAGGITGGDRLEWGAQIAAGGRAVLTTQACERSYRSTGATAQVLTRLDVGASAHLDWLPQETILFDASRLHRRLEVDLAQGATLTAIEAVLLGRSAMGETARDALFRDAWRIRRDGRLVHAEAAALTGHERERDALSLLSGNSAFATILHVAASADGAHRLGEQLRPQLAPGRIGLSVNGERLVIRAMAQTGLALRRMIVPLLVTLSGVGSLPRLWHL